MFKIIHPRTGYNDISYNLKFDRGVALTNDSAVAKRFETLGFEVISTKDEIKVTKTKSRKASTELVRKE